MAAKQISFLFHYFFPSDKPPIKGNKYETEGKKFSSFTELLEFRDGHLHTKIVIGKVEKDFGFSWRRTRDLVHCHYAAVIKTAKLDGRASRNWF